MITLFSIERGRGLRQVESMVRLNKSRRRRQRGDLAYIEQYKLLVQSAENVSDRRARINRYQSSLNLGILALHGLVPSFISHPALPFLIASAGIAITINWFLTLQSFRQTNRAKFIIIHSMERQLPRGIFQEERTLVREEARPPVRSDANVLGRAWSWLDGQYRKLKGYRGAISFERPIPVIFAALHLAAVVYAVYQRMGTD